MRRSLGRYRLLAVNGILLLAAAGSHWGRQIEAAGLPQADLLQRPGIAFRDWKATDKELTKERAEREKWKQEAREWADASIENGEELDRVKAEREKLEAALRATATDIRRRLHSDDLADAPFDEDLGDALNRIEAALSQATKRENG